MKNKACYLFILLCLSINLYSQDIIIKIDKSELKSKVIEIDNEYIKYKDFAFIDGPTYNIKKQQVFMIIYQNGRKEYIVNSDDIVTLNQKAQTTSTSSLTLTKKRNEGKSDSAIKYIGENLKMMISTNFHFSGPEFRIEKRVFKFTQIGLSYYTASGISFIYPHVTLTYLSNALHNSVSWISLGAAIIPATDLYPEIPSSTSFHYEFGEDYYFSKNFGASIYFPKLNAIFIGLIWRSSK